MVVVVVLLGRYLDSSCWYVVVLVTPSVGGSRSLGLSLG